MHTLANSHLPSMTVCKRYSITRRTLGNWMVDPRVGFPKPLTIRGRHYFDEGALLAWEKISPKRIAA